MLMNCTSRLWRHKRAGHAGSGISWLGNWYEPCVRVWRGDLASWRADRARALSLFSVRMRSVYKLACSGSSSSSPHKIITKNRCLIKKFPAPQTAGDRLRKLQRRDADFLTSSGYVRFSPRSLCHPPFRHLPSNTAKHRI